MNSSVELGLRDRKRLETHARLERAAVSLALRDGLALATVDAISEEAGVSSRTFFNYFDSKEDAVLGVRDTGLSSAAITAHSRPRAGDDLVQSVVRLILAVMGPMVSTPELREQRLAIIQSHPELLSRQVTQMTRMADELVAAVRTLVESDPDPSRRGTDAEMLLALCGSGVRIAIKEWIAAGSATPPEQLESRAISLIREVTKNIQ